MFKNNLAKENLAVMYLRLSKEDGEKTESNSISNQREIIDSYARKNQITIVKGPCQVVVEFLVDISKVFN